MKNLIDDLDSVPAIFTDSVRGVLLLHRNKDGGVGNQQHKAIKRISGNTEEWKAFIAELREMQQTTHQGYRIYSSVNARDVERSIHEFKRRQLEIECGSMFEFHNFYYDIKNRFFSCLMNPNSRADDNFLIDCDTLREYEFAKLQLDHTNLILMEYPTKNGFHIITRPFNPNDFGTMQIKKDDLMFIG